MTVPLPQHRSAARSLERADQLGGGKRLGCNARFIAMAHWQRDNQEEARRWYDQAVEWIAKNQPRNEELRRIRARAAELLKVEQNKD